MDKDMVIAWMIFVTIFVLVVLFLSKCFFKLLTTAAILN